MADSKKPEQTTKSVEELTAALERLQSVLSNFNSGATGLTDLKKSLEKHQELVAQVAESQNKSTRAFLENSKKHKAVQIEASRAMNLHNQTLQSNKISIDKYNDALKAVGITIGAKLLAKKLHLEKLGNAFNSLGKPLLDIEQRSIKTFGTIETGAGRLASEGGKALRSFLSEQNTGLAASSASLQTFSFSIEKAREQAVEELEGLTKAAGANAERFAAELSDPKALIGIRAMREALGLATEDVGTYIDRAAAFGTSVSAQLASAVRATKKYAKETGVSFGQVKKGQDVLRKNTKSFATFSEQQLARVAAASAKTGVSLATMGGGLIDSFDSFDQAAEKAAMLGQSFGMSIDAFDLFAAESPEERLQLIQKSAEQAGIDIANMGRRELNYLSELTGMGVEDTMKALGQGGLEVAAEVSSMSGAEDLQASLVAAQGENSRTVKELTTAIRAHIPTFVDSGEDILAGSIDRLIRNATGLRGAAEEQVGVSVRGAISGKVLPESGQSPGGIMGQIAKITSDPKWAKAQQEMMTVFLHEGEAGATRLSEVFVKHAEKITQTSSTSAGIKQLASEITEYGKEKIQKIKDAGGKILQSNLAKNAKRMLPGSDQGGTTERSEMLSATAETETNAAMRKGLAPSSSSGPINLVVNVSLPVDGDAIATAAYKGSIRPDVTGEQALQAAAAGENVADQ